jgi:DnaJ-class molecular chaperone
MPKVGGGRGDLYAEVRIVLPKDLSERERELVQELAALRTD